MSYLERSQAVKAEIEEDSNLVSLIRDHVQGNVPLEEIGRGTMNIIYRVGQTESGVWVALRENTVWGKKPEDFAASAVLYNSYCLEAEELSDSPNFCIGGTSKTKPFLLVEDVTEGGDYSVRYTGGGEKRVVLVKGSEVKRRAVDLGDEGPHDSINDDETYMEIIMGTFDIGQLKYFSPEAILDI